MNDTIVIFRLPGKGVEVWVETVFSRTGCYEPFRRATVGGREEAVKTAEGIHWVYENAHADYMG